MFLQCRGCDLLSNLSSDHFFHSIRMATPMNAFYFWVASSDDVMNCHLHKADKWRLPWMCLRFTCFEEHCCKNVAAALAKVGPNRPKLANAGLGQPRLAKVGPRRPKLANAGFGRPRLAKVGPSSPELANAGFGQPRLAKVGSSRPKLANAGFGQPRLAKIGPSSPKLANAGLGQPQLANHWARQAAVGQRWLWPAAAGRGCAVRKQKRGTSPCNFGVFIFFVFFVFCFRVASFWRRRASPCNFGVFGFFCFFVLHLLASARNFVQLWCLHIFYFFSWCLFWAA